MTLDEIKLFRTFMDRITYECESIPDDLLNDLAMLSAIVPPTLFQEIEDRKDGISSYREDQPC